MQPSHPDTPTPDQEPSRKPTLKAGLRHRHTPESAGTPAGQAFRQAVLDVENLRERLRELETTQAEARRQYWRQVGPLADVVVKARRSLFEPLETALTLAYFSRAEERQIEELLLSNALSLRDRFGEDVADLLSRFGPKSARPAASENHTAASHAAGHEAQQEAGRGQRKTKAQRAQEAAERAAQEDRQRLLGNTKTLYRQLARANHPDLERDPELARTKTARMQQITEAYEANDLYTLLQLLAEHTDDTPDAETDSVLTRYTQALRHQQDELKQRMNELKYGPSSRFAATGKKLEAELRQIKRQLRAEAGYLELVRRAIQSPDGLRQLLKELAAADQEVL